MKDDANKPYDPNEGTFETIKARPVKLKDNYKFFNRNPFFLFNTFLQIFLIRFFWEWLIARPFMGFKVKNKQHLKSVKKEGVIITANHIHPFDAFLIGTTLRPKKIYVLMRESNLGVPIFGRIMRWAGGVPLPTRPELFVKLLKEIPEQVSKNRSILVMPETALIPYHVGLRPFSSGAFRIAINAKSKILPAVFIYKKPKGLRKLLRKKPCFELHFLPSITVEKKASNHETIEFYKTYTRQVMLDYYNEHSEIK